jgi:hypothetical protein
MVTEEFWAMFSPEQQALMQENSRKYHLAGSELFAELREHRFDVRTLSDMRQPGYDGRGAVRILLKWYPRIEYVPLQIDIVHTLGERWASAALGPLLADFSERHGEGDPELLYAIGTSISSHAGDPIADRLLALASDRSFGASRAGIVHALSRLKKRRPEAVATLLRLVDDQTARVPAIEALGMAKALEARDQIAALKEDSSRPVREVAAEALRKLDRAAIRRSAPDSVS